MSESKPLEGKIYEAMAAIMSDIGSIGKNNRNQSQGFNFRGIDDCYEALHPVFSKHGVVLLPSVDSHEIFERQTNNGKIQFQHVISVLYTFIATDGSSVKCRAMGEAMDMQDKGLSKAMSVALKYAMFQTFLIPVRGVTPDPDADSPEETTQKMASEEQKHQLEELFTKLGYDAARQASGIKWAGGVPETGVNGLTEKQAVKLINQLRKA